MTAQKSFKRRVRARMAKTGESYTAARRRMLPEPEPLLPELEPATPESVPAALSAGTPRRAKEINTEESVRRNTGRGWDEWFAALDAWGARERTHTEIAAWLVDQRGLEGWWAQAVTVGYEQERGMRTPGQQCDGTFAANASKTVAVPLEQLYAAVADPEERFRWLDAALTPRGKARPDKVFRAVLDDEPGKVEFTFAGKSEGKAQVTVSHTRLPDAETSAKLKQRWREHLAALKSTLEA